MDPPEKKQNSDQREKNQNWRQPMTEIVNFFTNLLMTAWTTFVYAFLCWICDALDNALDRLQNYVLPEYEVPAFKPMSDAEREGLAFRIQEAARKDLQEIAERNLQMPIHPRTNSRAERRSRPYDPPETRNTPERESSSEINRGASTSGLSASGQIVQEDRVRETGLIIDTSSQQIELPSLKNFLEGPPTDSSTSSSEITTNSSEQSSDEVIGTGKDLPVPQELPPSPGMSVDADTKHLSGGAVWEGPSPPQSPPLFSEEDFAKITSGFPFGTEELDQGNSQLSISSQSQLITGSVSQTTVVSVVSPEDFDRLAANQQLPGTRRSISTPLSLEINVDASTSHLTGGSVLDTSPPPVSSPPLFSQDDFEKMMTELSSPSDLGKTEQMDSPLSPEIVGAISSHPSGGSVTETANSAIRTAPQFPKGDFFQGPLEAESGSEPSEMYMQQYGRNIRGTPYISLSDDDEPAVREIMSERFGGRVRACSMEDLRSEASKHRRLKFRRRNRPLGEAVPRSARILNILDRMDLQVSEEQLQEIKMHWSPQSSPRRYSSKPRKRFN